MAAAAAAAAATTYAFGQVRISASDVFFKTSLSIAFVNLKPIAKGHVLVMPERAVKRFGELTPAEVSDLYLTVQKVGAAVERAYHGESLSIVMQDGVAAGQSIHHVHVHVIPRRLGDWANNDDIYVELDKQAKQDTPRKPGVDNEARPPRSRDEMAQEALFLRTFFADAAAPS